MRDGESHILKARATLGFARYALAGEYIEEAGRGAYMAAYHAALAFIVARTGKTPKTHSGTRSEFARLARDEPRILREQVSLLGWSYELKNVSDYEQGTTVSLTEAKRAIQEAAQLIETISGLLISTRGSEQTAQENGDFEG